MAYKQKSIDQLLSDAQVAIDSALANPTLQGFLTPFGYTPEKIQVGQALLATALEAQQLKKTEYAEQIGATATLNTLRETADKEYRRHLKIARVAFKTNAAATSLLELNGDRKRSYSGWMAQTRQFYNGLLQNPELLTRMSEFGITSEILEATLASIDAVEQANTIQETEKGEARQATQDRDAAIDALTDWLDDYLNIARIALEDQPQLLETLGIAQSS